jgi:hypothetical protein
MFERLPKGLVLKSETYQRGEAIYTIILKNRFIPGINKTAMVYKDWEDDSSRLEIYQIKNYDIKDYLNCIRKGILTFPGEEGEIERLSEEIENLPKKARNKIYRKEKLNLIDRINIHSEEYADPAINSAIQKISNLSSSSKDLSQKVRRNKRLSVI